MEVKPLRTQTLNQSLPVQQNTITGVTQAPQYYETSTGNWTTTPPQTTGVTGGLDGSGAPAGGEAGPVYAPLNRALVDNTQRTIDQIPLLLQRALEAERTSYGNTMGEFGTQETGQRKQYGESTVTNQKNYDANFMDSLRAGSRGLASLFGILRGTGAEGRAEDIVGTQTSQDIRTGADTQKENQVELDTTLSSFLSDLERKRRLAGDTLANNERAYTRDYNTQLQELFGKMAGFYSEAGMTPEYNDWMGRAGSLTPTIAENSSRVVSPYDATPIQVKAPEISAFAGPTEQTITAGEGGQIGSGIFTMGDRRRREMTTAGV